MAIVNGIVLRYMIWDLTEFKKFVEGFMTHGTPEDSLAFTQIRRGSRLRVNGFYSNGKLLIVTEGTLTVDEARSMMPETTIGLTDLEVQTILNSLDILASSVIDAVRFDDKFRVNIEYNRGNNLE